jgi:hypothetical protein
VSNDDDAIRVPVAARRTGLSTRELYRRIDAGQLSAHRNDDGMVVIPVAALARMLGD